MSVFLPHNVLAQFATMVELVANASTRTGTFKRSAYRLTLGKEPDSAPDGLYYLDMVRADPHLRRWGDGSQITDSVVTVRLLYGRPGGSLGGGDRQSVLRNAADDCEKLADVCENPANYGSSTSGIRIVVFAGFSRVEDQPLGEIWEVRFNVQWQGDMDTTTVVDLTESHIILSSLSALAAYSVTSLSTGSQAFITDVWRAYRLSRTDTQTPDGTSIVAATPTGSGNWIAEWFGDESSGSIETTVA